MRVLVSELANSYSSIASIAAHPHHISRLSVDLREVREIGTCESTGGREEFTNSYRIPINFPPFGDKREVRVDRVSVEWVARVEGASGGY
jgi:hypothetical protein